MKNSLQKVDLSKLNKDNKFIVDWLSFSTEDYNDVDSLLEFLGIDHLTYTEMPGTQGYRKRLYFDGININYEPGSFFGQNVSDNRIWVEMSGKGCRSFETFSKLDCWDLLRAFRYYFKNLSVNRIDIAYDCFTNDIDLDDLEDRVYKGYVNSRFKPQNMLITKSSLKYSHTVELGSCRSDIMMRIYDKALERGYYDEKKDGFSWVRWEIQLRRSRCDAFINTFCDSEKPIGEIFKGIILNYFRPVVPDEDDSNRSRWNSPTWFINFIDNVEKLTLYVKATTDYNLDKCERYVYNQSGNALRTLLEIKGTEKVLQELQAQKPDNVPTKYKELIASNKNYQKIDDSAIVEELKKNANFVYVIRFWSNLFKLRYNNICSIGLRDAVLKLANDDYKAYYDNYKCAYSKLSDENKKVFYDYLDDLQIDYSVSEKENIFISYLRRYAKNVFFADNLYIDKEGRIVAESESSAIFKYLV